MLPGDRVKMFLDELLVLLISIGLFLSFLYLMNFFDGKIYVTIRRATLIKSLEIGFMGNLLCILFFSIVVYLSLILLFRIPHIVILIFLGLFLYQFYGINIYYPYLLILTIIVFSFSFIKVGNFLDRFVKYISLNIIVLEGLSLIPYILYPFMGGEIYRDGFWSISFLELKICYGLQNVYAIILFIYPYIALILFFLSIKLRKIRKISLKIGGKRRFFQLRLPSHEILDRKFSKILFIASIILVFITTLYPYSSKINPGQRPVGVDINRFYNDWLKDALKNDPVKMAFNASRGSRPLYLLSTYLIAKIFNIDPLIFNEIYVPIILYLMLILSIYYLSYRMTGRHDFAALASFLTITGYQTTIGIYSAYYANLMALSLIYLMFGLLFNDGLKYIVGACIISFTCNFIHPWTLEQGLLALFSISIIDFLHMRKINKKLLGKTFPPIVSAFLAEQVKIYMNNVGMIVASTEARTSFIFLRFWSSFKEINFFVKILYGGYMGTPLLLLFIPAIILVIFLDEKVYRFIFAWTFTLLPILFYDNIIQSRLYFNYPVGLLIPIITLYPCLFFKKSFTKKIFISAIIVTSLNYLLRCMANIHYL